MGLTRTASPTSEPVTLAEALAHLRLDASNVENAPGAPTVALASPVAPGNVDNGAHRYRVTFVTSAGETDGGTISSSVTIADKTVNGQVSLTAIPTGSSNVTSRKIYRTAAAGTTYLLLATIANNTATTYTDNIADTSLGAGVPSTNGTADPLVSSLIVAAREWAEGVTNRALCTQTWQLTLDEFPRYAYPSYQYDPDVYARRHSHQTHRRHWNEILFPWPNLRSVASIAYVDTAGANQTLDVSTAILVDTASLPGRIVPVYGTSWPLTRCQPNAVTITYTAGYGGASEVPVAIKQAMLLVIGDLYRNRESQLVGAGITVSENPAAKALLGPYLYREAV
jgi:hypothetical protein